MLDFLLFIASLLLVIKSADAAIRYSSKVAQMLGLSKHIMGFLIVAALSVLPETFISVDAALRGIPEFGLGTLFGSNVADLTLVFAVVLLFARKGVKVSSVVLKDQYLYFFALAVPLLLGLNGDFTRWEGLVIILSGCLFHWHALTHNKREVSRVKVEFSFLTLVLLLISVGFLLLGSHFVVESGVSIAEQLNLNPVLVAMMVVGLGTTLPEMLFSIRAVKSHYDSLALGDILGTVMTDATIIVGLIALISPFSFPARYVYVTGLFMLLAALLLYSFMQSGKLLAKKEGIFLVLFYVLFVLTEFTWSSF